MNREGICVWEGPLPGSALCHLQNCSGDETSTENGQGHLVYLMPVGRIIPQCMAETVKGLLMRLLVIQGTYCRASKIQAKKNHSYSVAFQSDKLLVVLLFPFDILPWSSYCSFSSSSRGQAGERSHIL